MATIAPYCNGGCGLRMEAGQDPWLAIIGERVKPATDYRTEMRSPVTLFLCPQCEAAGEQAKIEEFMFDIKAARLPDNSPRCVLGLIRGDYDIVDD